jgi:uncharacterized repeat protein (TIGR03803 family)
MLVQSRHFLLTALVFALLPAILAPASAKPPPYTEKILYSFSGADGANPQATLLLDKQGNLYGVTTSGGSSGNGTAFELTPPPVGQPSVPWSETVLYSFCSQANCTDGSIPAGLLRDGHGNLYGATIQGGVVNSNCPSGCGTVFKLDTTLNETVLYSFCSQPNCTDGFVPFGELVRDGSGKLYGMTSYGGQNSCPVDAGSDGCGTVFKLVPQTKKGKTTYTETVLYNFAGNPDGATTAGGLIRDASGNLYGDTYLGGNASCGGIGCGTVFKVGPAGNETVLHRFGGPTGDGAHPGGPAVGLVRDGTGNLYGVTGDGGSSGCGASSGYGCGTVFEVSPTGNEHMLYNFNGGSDGSVPLGTLILNAHNLYGTAINGGIGSCAPQRPNYPFSVGGCGVVFEVSPTGIETVLYSFTGTAGDGANPYAGLVRDKFGNLYGTTRLGGTNGLGTVFEISPVK